MARRRSNGEGTVHHNRDRGRWEGRVVVDGRRRKVTAKTKTDVLAKMARLRVADETGEVVADGNVTVGVVIRLWWSKVGEVRDVAPATRNLDRWACGLLEAELGSKRLRALRVEDVERGLANLAAGAHCRKFGETEERRPLTVRSVRQLRGTLGRVLDWAVRREMVRANVARLAELPAAGEATPRVSLTADQAVRLWAACGEADDDATGTYGALFRVQLATGLRPGEAAGLCWDAADLEAETLTVRRAVRVEGGRPMLVEALKTVQSERTIALRTSVVQVLTEQRTRVARLRLCAGERWSGEDLVFPTPTGGPLDPSNRRRALARFCEAAGVPTRLPNELRHSAASLLVEQGVPMVRIADQLGHASTRMLGEVYRHQLAPIVDVGVDIVDGA